MQNITILGSTGSIGVNTLDVVRNNMDRFCVYALTANNNVDKLLSQCLEFKPKFAVLRDSASAQLLQSKIASVELDTHVLSGVNGLSDVAGAEDVDMVMAAIVGGAGLTPTFRAVQKGKRVLLANKEALVMSGALFISEARKTGAQILPVDSEHNAIFQALPDDHSDLQKAGVRRILLTGSGGPFRSTPISELGAVTPDQACAHPNWVMGRKISVDSATMMNKGLEFIEANWLFNAFGQVEIVVHPQSVIHSMVEYLDGSVLAQLGKPDMRTPIAHCMGWPDRIESNAEYLDFNQLSSLTFEAPNFERFPCLQLAMQAAEAGASACIALNAANEIAVDAFLNVQIKFNQIAEVVSDVLSCWNNVEPESIDMVTELDGNARRIARDAVQKFGW